MDIFALGMKIMSQGLGEATAGIEALESKGKQAAQTLTATEHASAALANANRNLASGYQQTTRESAAAAEAVGGINVQQRAAIIAAQQLGGTSKNVFAQLRRDVQLATVDFKAGTISVGDYRTALATARQQAIALSGDARAVSGPGLGTFNQVLKETEQTATRTGVGLYQLRRGFSILAEEAAGTNRAVGSVLQGLLVFGVGNMAAIGIAAGLAAIALGYQALTKEARATAVAVAAARQEIETKIAGEVPGKVAAQERLNLLLAERTRLQNRLNELDRANPGLVASEGKRQDLFKLDVQIAEQRKLLGDAETKQIQDKLDLSQKLITGRTAYAQSIADAIALGRGDADSIAEARFFLQQYNSELRTHISLIDGRRLSQAELNEINDARNAIETALATPAKEAEAAEKLHLESIGKRIGALESLNTMQGLTGPQTVTLRGLFTQLRTEIDSGTLSVDNLALANERLAKAQELLVKTTAASFQRRAFTFGLGPVAPAAPDLTKGFGQFTAPTLPDAGTGLAGMTTKFEHDMAAAVAKAKVTTNAAKADLTAMVFDLGAAIGDALRTAFVNVAASFGKLFGSLFSGADASKAFGDFGKQVLAALGGVFQQLGAAMVAASPIFKAIGAAMHHPITAGFALALYGAALIALGATLGAIAQGTPGSGSAAGGAAGGANAEQPIRVILVDTATRAAGQVKQPDPFIFAPTIIGANDPTAQRQIMELVRNAQRRNLPQGI